MQRRSATVPPRPTHLSTCHSAARSKRQAYFARTAGLVLALQVPYSATFVAAFGIILSSTNCEYPLRVRASLLAASPVVRGRHTRAHAPACPLRQAGQGSPAAECTCRGARKQRYWQLALLWLRDACCQLLVPKALLPRALEDA